MARLPVRIGVLAALLTLSPPAPASASRRDGDDDLAVVRQRRVASLLPASDTPEVQQQRDVIMAQVMKYGPF